LAAPTLGGCAGAVVSGTEGQTVRGRHQQITERLRTELVRDKSTKTDVLKALGEPDGTGQFGGWLGVRGPEHAKLGPAEVWYYEDSKASFAQNLQQQVRVMLVFFKGEVFDGYLWFTNTTTGAYR
jgi:hypothetical protein